MYIWRWVSFRKSGTDIDLLIGCDLKPVRHGKLVALLIILFSSVFHEFPDYSYMEF